MIYPNATSASPFLLALEPYYAMCNYLAGQISFSGALAQGDGHPVLVIPGLAASGAATLDLRTRLRDLGYAVYDWKHGINSGHGHDLDGWLMILGRQVEELHELHQSPVSIIGWSLGGIYARELARLHPTRVRQVITLATPYGIVGETSRHASAGIPVPSASIYSQTDGIVSWEKCIGPTSSRHRNIEVSGVSHFGMVHHPEILSVIAGLLSEPAMKPPAAASRASHDHRDRAVS